MPFLFFYAGYCVLCGALYLFVYKRQEKASAAARLLESLTVVPLGIAGALLFYRPDKGYREPAAADGRAPAPVRIRKDAERKRIPMSEALSLNDHLLCCDLLMEALRDNPQKFLPSIRMALRDGDSETSHYAAAAIMDMQKSLMESIALSCGRYIKEPGDGVRLKCYADALCRCIDSRLMDEGTTRRLKEQYCDVLDLQLERSPGPDIYEKRIEYALEQRQFSTALPLCERFLEEYPREDAAYCAFMRCKIKMRDHEGLRDFLLRLGSAPVELKADTLKRVRCLREILLYAPMDILADRCLSAGGNDFL